MPQISYKWNSSEAELSISFPRELVFNFEFLTMTTQMLFLIDRFPCEKVTFSCSADADYDKLSKAYIYNLLLNVAKRKKARWTLTLKSKIESTVHSKKAENYETVQSLAEKVMSDELNCYLFKNNENVNIPTDELTRLLVEKNITFDPEVMKEFLGTTIGEIFSNSTHHSAQDEFFFMYDITFSPEANKLQMCVTIIDYGRTIVENVNDFFHTRSEPLKSGGDCIGWAIGSGNTTRGGSGGYGLPTLIQYITAAHGDLFIFSGNAYFRLEKGKTEIGECSDGLFNGTSVVFRVPLLDTSTALSYDPSLKLVQSISLDNI